MNRLIGLLLALGLGLWAQRILSGPEPGIPRDALLLFILAAVLFVWQAAAPAVFRNPGAAITRSWLRPGRWLSLAGLAAGLLAGILLWRNLQSQMGLLLWPVATALFVAGTFLEGDVQGHDHGGKLGEDTANAGLGQVGWDPDAARGHGLAGSLETLAAWFRSHWDLLVLAAILVMAAWARLHQLDIYPNGCQSDECNNGLDALKWLGGAPYVPYAETNEGQATLFTYLIAAAFRLLGVGVTQMRVVSAVAGVATVAAFYLLSRDLYGRPAALVATALLAADRWHITFSRIVYELILQPLAMVLLLFTLLRGLRSGRRRYWALAGVCLAVGMNTYTAFRVVPFLIAAYLAFWALRTWVVDRPNLRHDLRGMLVLAAGALVGILPLGIYIVQNWRVFTSRMRHISVLQDVEQAGSLQPILDNLRKTLYMFNWQGDNAALNNLPGAPMLGSLAAVALVLGLAYSLWYLWRGEPVSVLYVFWFGAVASLAVLSVAQEAPSARRTIGLLPLIYLFVALVADQLIRVWQLALDGFGKRALGIGVAAAVLLASLGSIRTYFADQAPHPDVWNAYSPSESAVGRYLATLPRDAVVLVSPQYEHHSAVRLIGRDQPYRALQPLADLPYRGPANGPLVYVLEPDDQPTLNLLARLYPAGSATIEPDRFDRPLFISYVVPATAVTAPGGIEGQFYSTYPPTTAPEATQWTPSLDLDLSSLAGAPGTPGRMQPAFALWEGTLVVPEYGDYRFDLLATAAAASLQIGLEHRLDLLAGGEGTLSATLPAGYHPLRLEVQPGASEGAPPGRLRLTWSGPGFAGSVVGGEALAPFRLGSQGLVSYTYPNVEWQGTPAEVRIDPLVTPDSRLSAPYSILWRGKIAIPQSGTYVLGTLSDDGSFVSIDGQLVVDNGGSHGAEDRSGTVYLEQGFHDLEVRYFELGGSQEMQLWWQPPGQGRSWIDSQYLLPVEGTVPAGLALPSLPQAAPVVEAEELDTGRRPGERAQGPGVVPPPRPAAVHPPLTAEPLWSYGSCGSSPGQLNMPRGVAISPVTGDLFIADTGNARIVRLDPQGQFVQAFPAVSGEPDSLQEPVDLVVEPTGMVLVLDALAQQLLRYSPDGELLATFGVDQAFYRPRGLDVSAAGQIAVADTGGARIVRMSSDGAALDQVGGRESDLARSQPTDAAVPQTGDLYYVEAESGAITRLHADGTVDRWLATLPANTIDGPHLAQRPTGGVYASDPEGRRVLAFDPDGNPVGQIGGDAGLLKPVGVAARVETAESDLMVVVDSQLCQVMAWQVSVTPPPR